MAKISLLQEAFFVNESSLPVELLIPKNERVEVFYDRNRFSYVVNSTAEEQQSVVLQPQESLRIL